MEDEELCLRLQEAVQVGEECLLPLIQLAEELLRELDVEPQVVEASEVVVEELWEPPAVVARPSLGRRAMFSHHIIAPGKRQAIKEWALQLDLGGLVKVPLASFATAIYADRGRFALKKPTYMLYTYYTCTNIYVYVW